MYYLLALLRRSMAWATEAESASGLAEASWKLEAGATSAGTDDLSAAAISTSEGRSTYAAPGLPLIDA